MPTLHLIYLSCNVRQPHQSTDSLFSKAQPDPLGTLWNLPSKMRMCMVQDNRIKALTGKHFWSQEQEGRARCGTLCRREPTQYFKNMWPIFSPLQIGSLTKAPRFLKSFILAQGKIHKTVFVHAKQCLLSAACFLPTPGYTSYPKHNILKTQNRSRKPYNQLYWFRIS